ncbi:thiol:disulfide interchange protein [Pandoraea terrae]|uniref:Thiol:disulfide interchange protein DsbD n=1 Tax=Pandoraea terrae TaxID=1537710 RepID=A0A5E4Y1X2_9BURK|nr:protein-disulfide reductase DsbD [Pandoraea terrae]VVE42302.1 thiol:disulfide interchange protein [Pandoraea terrae]
MKRIILLWTIGLWLTLQGVALHARDFLSPEQAFQLSVDTSNPGETRLTWQIAKGYYLYRDHMVIHQTPANSVASVDLPSGIKKHDENFGDTEVYRDSVTVRVATADAKQLDVQWQGCADAGVCYPPQQQTLPLTAISAKSGSSNAQMPSPGAADRDINNSEGHFTGLLAGTGWAGVLTVFFGMGILLAFTPCVLPMVPILSSLVVGSQVSPRRAFALSLSFVLSMAMTYAALGVVAALAGANLQAFLQNRWTVLGFGMIFVILALAMFGVFELQLPSGLRQRLADASQRQRGGTLAGTAAMGFLSALLVGPCMSAPLAGALLYIAQTGNTVRGGLALLALGFGMGVPLLLVGTAGGRLLPRPGPWMNRTKVGFGFILLATAIWMAQRVVSAPLALGLWGALLLAIACALAFTSGANNRTAFSLVVPRYFGLLLGLWGGVMLVGAAAGADDPWRPLSFGNQPGAVTTKAATSSFVTVGNANQFQQQLSAAKASHQAVLVDFSADWCVSCHVIDRTVFGDARVQQALSGVRLVRVDVTRNSPDQQALMQRLQVMGPPTVMLLQSSGEEQRSLRFVGEFGADDLLEHLVQLREREGA